ncbi:MAG TPA: fibronectin type III domain-containing protein [Aeromicrobium sp.]|nr:fibronectin type III domain-containing protein [Aeromicrobium sp.]
MTSSSCKKLVGLVTGILVVLATLTFNASSAGAATTLAVPGSIKATPKALSATISWAKVSGAAKYRVVYREEAVTTTKTLLPATTNVTLTGLKPSTKYVYTVSALNSKGVEGKRSATLKFTTTKLTAPTGVEAAPSAAGPGTDITWNKVAGAAKYRVDYREDSATTSAVIFPAAASTGIMINALKPNTKHVFTVSAIDATGVEGTRTAKINFTTRAAAAQPTTNINANTTGVPVALRNKLVLNAPASQKLVITEPKQIISGLDFVGKIRIKASGVIIRNTRVRGQNSDGDGLIQVDAGVTGTLIEDSEIYNEWTDLTAHNGTMGIVGENLTLTRVNVHDVVDNVHLIGGNVKIQDSWLHSNHHFENDKNASNGPTHDDNIQMLGGEKILITGNRLEGSKNSAIMAAQDKAAIKELRIEGNLIGGGKCSIYFLAKSNFGAMATYGNKVIGNQFQPTQNTNNRCAIYPNKGSEPTLSNNIWADTGKLVEFGDQKAN